MKEVTPKRVMTRVYNQKRKQIYITHETWAMLRRNADSKELEGFDFLATDEEIAYKGKIRRVLKLIKVNKYTLTEGEEDVYSSPENPIGVTVI